MTRTTKGVGPVLAVAMMVALLPAAASGAGPDEPPALLSPATRPRTAADAPFHSTRHRLVEVDAAALFGDDGRPRTVDELPRVGLEIFPDASFTGTVTDVVRNGLGRSWVGDLDGAAGGYFFVAAAGGEIAIHVASPDGVFEVIPAGDGLHRAFEIDQSAFTDHPPGEYTPPDVDPAAGPAGAGGRAADSDGLIDVLVLYTPAAKAAVGGTGAMKALIALAMTETNQSYERSGVVARLRLVHLEEVSYTEAGTNAFDAALDDMIAGVGALSAAGQLRDTYGADMVSLIIQDGQYCGLAAGILPSAAYAYQVTAWHCATGYYSFGHEFGHLQGAHHDQYVDTNWRFANGHGYVHTGDTYRWRTIMAYNNECASLGYNCTRLAWWSNPERNVAPDWGGDPAGDGYPTRNFEVLNASASQVAGHRGTVIGDEFDAWFTRNDGGWAPASGDWIRNEDGHYVSSGVRYAHASAKHHSGYGDLTYVVRMKRRGDEGEPNWIVVRSRPGRQIEGGLWVPGYYFMYRSSGEFSIVERKRNGAEIVKVPWTAHPSIRTGARWNKLKIVAGGTVLRFFINGERVARFRDRTLDVGQVGFGFYRSGRHQKLLVDFARLWNTPTI